MILNGIRKKESHQYSKQSQDCYSISHHTASMQKEVTNLGHFIMNHSKIDFVNENFSVGHYSTRSLVGIHRKIGKPDQDDRWAYPGSWFPNVKYEEVWDIFFGLSLNISILATFLPLSTNDLVECMDFGCSGLDDGMLDASDLLDVKVHTVVLRRSGFW